MTERKEGRERKQEEKGEEEGRKEETCIELTFNYFPLLLCFLEAIHMRKKCVTLTYLNNLYQE